MRLVRRRDEVAFERRVRPWRWPTARPARSRQREDLVRAGLERFPGGILLSPSADRDTVGAIVGGVAALGVGHEGLPASWLAAREPLPGA